MRKLLILAPILLVLGVAAVSKFIQVRRDLIVQRQQMDTQWIEVRQVLAQRAELAPDLADAVKARSRKGSPVFQEIADSCAALGGAHNPEETLKANARLSHALWSLLALSENYPALRSDATFQRLQDELAAIENSIAVERQKYNESLEHYNAQLQRFPDNMVASLCGFGRNDAYFQTDIAGRIEPKG